MLSYEFLLESFSFRVIVVLIDFEVFGIVSIMAVDTVAIESTFYASCKTLTIKFHTF